MAKVKRAAPIAVSGPEIKSLNAVRYDPKQIGKQPHSDFDEFIADLGVMADWFESLGAASTSATTTSRR